MQQVIHSFHRFIEHLLHSRLCEVRWVKMMNKAVFQAVTFEQEFPCPSLTSSRLGIFAKPISSIKKKKKKETNETRMKKIFTHLNLILAILLLWLQKKGFGKAR